MDQSLTRERSRKNLIMACELPENLAEANKYVVGVRKKARAPEGLLAWVARFHAWRRGE